MPHDIQVGQNTFVDLQEKEKYVIGKAENIAIEGQLLPETRRDRGPSPTMPRLRQMGEDGVLRWRTSALEPLEDR